MSQKQQSLFEGIRSSLEGNIEYTAMSINAYAANHKHWAISFSGGKDSSATLAIVIYLIETGQVPRPETLTVLYADTGLELLPLHHTAMQILQEVKRRGYRVKIVRPELDKRFFVYMFGRGVPPPSNTFRWCTVMLKIDPIIKALKELREENGGKFLSMIGVRIGESAARDARIAIACGKDAECGQGYYQETTPASIADVMAPIIQWRVCHVWDLLQGFGPDHGLPTSPIARIYGQGTDLEDIASRTGCTACNLASRDTTLERILKLEEWRYLEPLRRLKPLYAELKKPFRRLRKTTPELTSDGKIVANPNRMGPLTMEARLWGMEQVLEIQRDINDQAILKNRPFIQLISDEEKRRIYELVAANTWPNRWSGEEDTGDVPFDRVYSEKITQPLLVVAS